MFASPVLSPSSGTGAVRRSLQYSAAWLALLRCSCWCRGRQVARRAGLWRWRWRRSLRTGAHAASHLHRRASVPVPGCQKPQAQRLQLVLLSMDTNHRVRRGSALAAPPAGRTNACSGHCCDGTAKPSSLVARWTLGTTGSGLRWRVAGPVGERRVVSSRV